MDLINDRVKYYIYYLFNITKWYLDGTDTNAVTNSPKYVDTTLNAWHHHYVELTNATDDITGWNVIMQVIDTEGQGKFDNIYMFDAALTTAQITRLANGGNGADVGSFTSTDVTIHI